MIEELKQWGCDTADAMGRMLDDEEFYKECLLDIPVDPNFELLGKALSSHEVQKAFDAAHTIKGVLANLGLTPMYNTVIAMVEPLRAGDDKNLASLYQELLAQKDKLADILSKS